ncbi:MAG: hypothetical protein V5A14_02445 [Desulfohalobiaceae bacterium]
MNLRTVCLAAVIGILLAGCSPFAGAPEPEYYRLRYEKETRQCASAFSSEVRAWRFTAAEPFEQRRMVLWDRDRTVRFSESGQWVAAPASMLTEQIRRDLSESGLFAGTAGDFDSGPVSLELSGRIRRFVARPCESGYRALLGVSVELKERGTGENPLLQKSYSLESDCFPAGKASEFAEAMSRLASEFSDRLQSDLCRIAGERASVGEEAARD